MTGVMDDTPLLVAHANRILDQLDVSADERARFSTRVRVAEPDWGEELYETEQMSWIDLRWVRSPERRRVTVYLDGSEDSRCEAAVQIADAFQDEIQVEFRDQRPRCPTHSQPMVVRRSTDRPGYRLGRGAGCVLGIYPVE
jgi:hypothetical protein